jgi:hypothetical protein
MTKLSLGMFLNIGFDLIPIASVIAYLFAVSAYRYQSSQCLDFGQSPLKFENKLLSLLLYPLALGDVPEDQNGTDDVSFVIPDRCSAVIDGYFCAILGSKSMTCQADNNALLDYLRYGVLLLNLSPKPLPASSPSALRPQDS